MSERTCAHAACSCPVPADEDFCALSCRREAERPLDEEEGCSCGHQACLGAAGEAGEQALRRGAQEAAEAPESPEPSG